MIIPNVMFVIVMALGNSLIQGSTTACSYPFTSLGDNCYYFSTATASWDDAYIECLQRGAYLANLETFDEYMILRSRLASFRNGQNYAIGGRNINREINDGDWRWVKNGSLSKMSYFAFGPRQPTGTKPLPKIACGSFLNSNMSSLIRSVVMLRDIFVKNNDFDYMVAQIYSGYHQLNIIDHKLELSHNGI